MLRRRRPRTFSPLHKSSRTGATASRGIVLCAASARALYPLIAAALLSACGTTSDPHRITLRDGQVFQSVNQPKLDEKTGYFRFRDRQDKDILLRQDEVIVIERQ